MTYPTLENDRFHAEEGLHITVQVPETHVRAVLDAVMAETDLKYGDYDCVSFTTSAGIQRFRSLGTGRNRATTTAVEVHCVEVSFFLGNGHSNTSHVLKAVYASHPYEEPVIYLHPCVRTVHIRGLDEDNPNRFWNREADNWVPDEHR